MDYKEEDIYASFTDIKMASVPDTNPLSLRIIPETNCSHREMMTKIFTLVNLSAQGNDKDTSAGIDIIVVLDKSESMNEESKLSNALATVDYLVNRLRKEDRIHIIAFNHDVECITSDLIQVDVKNRSFILERIKTIKAEGATDIHSALEAAVSTASSCSQTNRISTIMFFTDGDATCGLRGDILRSYIRSCKVPKNCTVFTFGYGREHKSDVLTLISGLSRGGVYYFIESSDNIGTTFSECINGVLSIQAMDIEVRLSMYGGCGITDVGTSYLTKTEEKYKKYTIFYGSIFGEEQRNILLNMTIKPIEGPEKTIRSPTMVSVDQQKVLDVEVSFLRPGNLYREFFTSTLIIKRDDSTRQWISPIEIDEQKQRIECYKIIKDVIEKLDQNEEKALERLDKVIQFIKSSESYAVNSFFQDLVKDLEDCVSVIMKKKDVHYLTCIQLMYSSERATGTNYFKYLSEGEYMSSNNLASKRSLNYGYSSFYNKDKVSEAKNNIESLLSKYSYF